MILKNLLLTVLILPVIGSFFLVLVTSNNKKLLRIVSINSSCFTFTLSLFLWVFFNNSVSFQFITKILWLPNLNLNFILGIDGVSLFFILLTTLLIFLCLLTSWDSVEKRLKEYLISFLVMEFFLVGVFCILDLLFFYIFFESVLIPMFLIIGIWGSRERKVRATFFFFLYTLIGSILMLLSIIYIYSQIGTTDYETLLTVVFSSKEQKVLWLTFFSSFASKVPMIPVHLWLPEAHVEAPTSGSVILAGILLKLGTYGLIRFLLPLFPNACFYFSPFVYSLSIIGIIYTSFTAVRQTDFKRIIAYTSIAHMNLVILGIFSFNIIGIQGALLQSLSHGFVASSLFLIIGVVYDRYSTRIVKYYGGLTHVMPVYIFIFLFFTMANIGLPGTSSFVGELLILIGSFKSNTSITFLGATGMVFGGCYSLWLFNRIAYGNLKNQYFNQFIDINKKEFLTFLPLIIGTFLMGILPNIFLIPMHLSTSLLIEFLQMRNQRSVMVARQYII